MKTTRARYEEIAEAIEEQLIRGRVDGDRLPPIRELMQNFEISQVTVDRSLNLLLKNGRVSRIPGRGYFVGATGGRERGGSHRSAAAGSRLFQIDFCSFFTSSSMRLSPLYSRMLLKMMDAANARACLLNAFTYDEMGSLEAFREKFEHSAAKVCIMLGCNKASYDHVLRALQIPTVHLYPNVLDRTMNALQIDNAAAMRLLLEPLIAQGHRKIAMLHGQGDANNFNLLDQQERIEAYYQLMRQHNLSTVGNRVIFGGFTPELGYEATDFLLRQEPGSRPTALLCNDGNVEGAYQAIADHGLRIPQEISVVGFDNGDNIRKLQPPLTTIDIHWPHAIETALDTAVRLAKPGAAEIGLRKLPVEYIPRASTGPVPAEAHLP